MVLLWTWSQVPLAYKTITKKTIKHVNDIYTFQPTFAIMQNNTILF